MRAALALLSLAGCAHAPPAPHGIPNFAQVEPGLFRGGEPSPAGWAFLESIGVCQRVQLDYDEERVVPPPASMSVVKLSMPPADADDLFRGPARGELGAAAWVLWERRCPTFVGCLHGQDRTGAVVATYRRLYRGWTRSAALGEARALGFHVALVGLLRAYEEEP